MDFLYQHQNIITAISIILLIIIGIILFKILSKKSWERVQRMNNLKSGKAPGKEIIGKIKSIEPLFSRGGDIEGLLWEINGYYVVAEGKDPTTKKMKYYRKEYKFDSATQDLFILHGEIKFWGRKLSKEHKEFFNKQVKKYVKIGDKVRIIVSLENPQDCYIKNIIHN